MPLDVYLFRTSRPSSLAHRSSPPLGSAWGSTRSALLSLTVALGWLVGCAHERSAAATSEHAAPEATSHHEHHPGREPGHEPGHAHPGPDDAMFSGRAHDHEHGHGHHGKGHRFNDAERWAARFEDPARDAWQKPEAVLDWLALPADAIVADIGSATGYFPVRIARRLPEGRVWGIDLEPDMVRYLNDRATRESLANLRSVRGTAADPMLPEPVDVVLLVDTYHHIEGRPAYFAKVARAMRPGGQLVIIDFQPGELPVGPPPRMKIPPAQVERELQAAGCTLTRSDDELLPYQFIRVFACEGAA